MAHEITTADGVFLANNKPAWHGLGHVFEGYPNRAEAQQIAHPWEPIEEPVFTNRPTITENGPEEVFEPIEGFKTIVRSDNAQPLGVVRDSYQPVANDAMWDIAEALEKSGDDVMFETGGSLAGGRKVWLLLKLKEPLTVPGDPHGATIPYFTLQNAHDGTASFRGQATMMRIVCANTAHMADLDAKRRGMSFTFRHTKNSAERIEEARQIVGQWREGLTHQQEHYEYLLGLGVERDGVDAFVDRLIPERPGIDTDRQRDNIDKARREFMGVLNSETNEGVNRTAYGLVQASIEYFEHKVRANSQESRFARSYLSRNRYVQGAADLALEVAR